MSGRWKSWIAMPLLALVGATLAPLGTAAAQEQRLGAVDNVDGATGDHADWASAHLSC